MKILELKVLSLLLFILFIASCDDQICIDGEGEITTSTLVVADFTGINLITSSNVTIQQGAEISVEATGHPNVIDKVKTNVTNGVWNIDLEDGCYDNYELSFTITLPMLSRVDIDGAGDVVVQNFTNQGDLNVSIEGSGSVEFNEFVGTENLTVTISGSGDITGNADFTNLTQLNVSISGSGVYNAFPIQSENATVDISGSGNIALTAMTTLNVNISGSGSVRYKGNPTITSSITGSGQLIDAN